MSANHRNKTKTLTYFQNENINNIQKISSCEKESFKKDRSRLNLIYNNVFFPNNFSKSSVNTNISNIRDDLQFNSYAIKPIAEDNFEDSFIQKRKKIYKPPSIINNRIISFQKQKNKLILEFSLFDEKLIFKDINRSYLQDQCSDDGSESSDEQIIESKKLLSLGLEDSIKQISKSLKKNQKENLLFYFSFRLSGFNSPFWKYNLSKFNRY